MTNSLGFSIPSLVSQELLSPSKTRWLATFARTHTDRNFLPLMFHSFKDVKLWKLRKNLTNVMSPCSSLDLFQMLETVQRPSSHPQAP